MLLESFDTGAGCRTQINERYHASNPVCEPARTTANIVNNYQPVYQQSRVNDIEWPMKHFF